MKMNVVSAGALAAAAIALALSGAATPVAAKKAPVHCMGVNSCKGASACKTASNGCKGQNACKGQGWLPEKTAKACEAKGGAVG